MRLGFRRGGGVIDEGTDGLLLMEGSSLVDYTLMIILIAAAQFFAFIDHGGGGSTQCT